MIVALIVLGLVIGLGTLAAILWSIYRPSKRIWPPQSYNAFTPVLVWTPTFLLFGVIVGLGVLQWGQLGWPSWLRHGLGWPLIVLGNVGVWYEVAEFGIRKTGGGGGSLRTDGLYRFSRNPQYVADSLMLVGWAIVSASSGAAFIGLLGIIVLLAAPFAEETWLKEQYGQPYKDYCKTVRRYL